MRTLLVVNPKATATTPAVREVLAHALASETKLDVVETQARGHAVELAQQAAQDGLDVVVALGGDGTVNEVVNGLLAGGPRADLPALGVVPGGNANVFARALGLPGSPVEATGVLLDGLARDRRRRVNLGKAGERYFTFCAGMGLDAAVVRKVEQRRAKGARATPGLFVREAVGHFFLGADRSEPELALERPGADPVPLGLALICNSDPWTYLASHPVRPCPTASFDTGLDLFGVRHLGTLTVLRHLRQILSREPHLRARALVTEHDADELVLTARHPVPLQVDGDDLGDVSRVVLRSVRNALSVVV